MPDYGFEYNAGRDNYVVNEQQMLVVRRIFRMVGVESYPINAVKKAFDRGGVPTPGGARFWNQTFLRRMIRDDVYRPHSFREVEERVAPEVSVRLERDTRYGIWWFNRRAKLLEGYAGMVPEALDSLGPEERHRIYKMLRSKVLVYSEARLEVSGALGAGHPVCLCEPSSKW